nr:AAA family ATPase [Planctomycetota bacterium]
MAKKSPTFACKECGDSFARWAGRCPSCGAMNAIAEITAGEAGLIARGADHAKAAAGLAIESIADASSLASTERFSTGLPELDRVLGGGLVPASLVLLGGEPGVGKSTLLLSALAAISKDRRALLVTGEESTAQVKLRAARLGGAEQVEILAATELE